MLTNLRLLAGVAADLSIVIGGNGRKGNTYPCTKSMHAGVGVLDNLLLLISVTANLSIVRGDKGRKRIILTLHTVYPTWTLLRLTVSACKGEYAAVEANQWAPMTGGVHAHSCHHHWRGKPAVANNNLKCNKMLVKKQTDGAVEKTLTRKQFQYSHLCSAAMVLFIRQDCSSCLIKSGHGCLKWLGSCFTAQLGQ